MSAVGCVCKAWADASYSTTVTIIDGGLPYPNRPPPASHLLYVLKKALPNCFSGCRSVDVRRETGRDGEIFASRIREFAPLAAAVASVAKSSTLLLVLPHLRARLIERRGEDSGVGIG